MYISILKIINLTFQKCFYEILNSIILFKLFIMPSSQGTLCLFLRGFFNSDIRVKDQNQLYYKNEDDDYFTETSEGSFLYFNANLKSFELEFKFILKNNKPIIKKCRFDQLDLKYFEPKTFFIALEDAQISENSHYLIIDCFYFSTNPDDGKLDDKSFYLMDFEIMNISNIEKTIQNFEKPLSIMKKPVGYTIREYFIEFYYINQLYTVNLTKGKDGSYQINPKPNSFLISKEFISPLKIKVSM